MADARDQSWLDDVKRVLAPQFEDVAEEAVTTPPTEASSDPPARTRRRAKTSTKAPRAKRTKQATH